MFNVILLPRVIKALDDLSDEDYDFVVSALSMLAQNPFPGVGGDKEKLKGFKNRYRIHISRTYSAIYAIYKDTKEVHVSLFGTIGWVHKKYNS